MNARAVMRVSAPDETSIEPSRPFERWFGKYTTRVAWLALAVAFLLPPSGIGINLCWLRGDFRLLCPGCGLTRSLSCAVRGSFYESWLFPPFGPFIVVMFFLVASVSLLPNEKRRQLADWMERRIQVFRSFTVAFVASFCAYGLLRALLQLAGVCQFHA